MADIKGRPKKAVRQEKFVGFFVTRKEYAIIQKNVKEAGVNVSDYFRQVAVNAYVKAKWTEEERQMVKRLIKFANEIHQLKVERGAMEAEAAFLRGMGLMDEIIKKISHER